MLLYGKEKIATYSLIKRIGYMRRNNFCFKGTIFGIKISCIPSNVDIHIHNTWKDIKK